MTTKKHNVSQQPARNLNPGSLRILCLLSCLCIIPGAQADRSFHDEAKKADVVTLTLPSPVTRKKPNQYIEQLISAAMATRGKQVQFRYFSLPTNQFRLNKLLQQGESIDVAWLPANKSRTDSLDYIALPLYQGVHGKRLLFIKNGMQARFDEVKNLSELNQLVALQERSWSDYKIFKDNGLQVNGDLGYDAMISALGRGIGDYFPRSALTIFAEFRQAKKQGVIIEQGLLLEYPMYVLLFLSDKQPWIMSDLHAGFKIIIDNGVFSSLFGQFYQSRLAQLHLADRRRIILKNKEIPDRLVEELKQHIFVD